MSEWNMYDILSEGKHSSCGMIQGGLRRGGMTPALPSCMPVITEDVGQIEAANATVLPRGTYIKHKSCSNEDKKNTGWNHIQ